METGKAFGWVKPSTTGVDLGESQGGFYGPLLTEERVREIVREELEAVWKAAAKLAVVGPTRSLADPVTSLSPSHEG